MYKLNVSWMLCCLYTLCYSRNIFLWNYCAGCVCSFLICNKFLRLVYMGIYCWFCQLFSLLLGHTFMYIAHIQGTGLKWLVDVNDVFTFFLSQTLISSVSSSRAKTSRFFSKLTSPAFFHGNFSFLFKPLLSLLIQYSFALFSFQSAIFF